MNIIPPIKDVVVSARKTYLHWVILSQISISLLAATIIVVLANTTEKELFGNLRYLIAILAVFSFFSLPGMGNMLARRARIMSRDQLLTAVYSQCRWGLGATYGAVLFGLYHFFFGSEELAIAFFIAGTFAPIANLFQIPGYVLAGLKRFRRKTIVDSSVMGTIVIAAFIAGTFSENIIGLVTYYYGIQVIGVMLGLLYVHKLLPKHHVDIHTEFNKHDVAYGKQLTLFQIPFTLMPAVEKILIFLFLGPVSLALFVVAALPAEHFKTAFRNLVQFYILPHAENRHMTIKKWLGITSIIVFSGALILAILILIFLPILFPDFDNTINYALLLILALLPLPLHTIVVMWIAHRNLKKLKTYAITAAVINISLFLILLPTHGIFGAVIAKIISEALGGLTVLYLRTEKD